MKKTVENIALACLVFLPFLMGMAPASREIALKPGLSPKLLKMALKAENWTQKQGAVHAPHFLTIVDYSQPSSAKRLWVVDLESKQVVMNIPVSHGKGSGQLYARRFSNQPHSYASSLGVYVTEGTYRGKHGLSVRLKGLEKGKNSNAENREIVMHSAWYMKPAFLKQHGYYGRSWGCFAVNPAAAARLFHLVGHGTVIFAYAPSEGNTY